MLKRRGRYYLRIWVAGRVASERSAKTSNRRDAERAAIALEQQLAVDAEQWRHVADSYEASVLTHQSETHLANWRVARRHLERHCCPVLISDVGASMLLTLVTKLRGEKLAAESIRTYLRYLGGCLAWARSAELLDQVPSLPKVAAKRGRKAKWVPIGSSGLLGEPNSTRFIKNRKPAKWLQSKGLRTLQYLAGHYSVPIVLA